MNVIGKISHVKRFNYNDTFDHRSDFLKSPGLICFKGNNDYFQRAFNSTFEPCVLQFLISILLMNKKILWLASWYPNELSPIDGDFIQRHAQAVSLIRPVHLIYVKKDEAGRVTKSIKQCYEKNGNLEETIIYYKPIKTGIIFLDKLISNAAYKRYYKRAILKHIRDNGKPQAVHLHVAMKAGLIALWVKKKLGIPYILSEHWTGYLPGAKPNIEAANPLLKKWFNKIFANASLITTVSKCLGDAIQNRFNVDFQMVPNVVNTDLFHPIEKPKRVAPRFIHISTNTYQKNTDQILAAFAGVKKMGYDFTIEFYVPDSSELEPVVEKYQLNSETTLHGEVLQAVLAKALAQADALVLYSRYETFGCVVIEANASGLPAILSDLPVFREYCAENKNVVFANPDDVPALSDAIISFIDMRKIFDKNEIAQFAKDNFGYEVVAKQFDDLYKRFGETN
jgi:glycosyltransferase involved in cell wall biosynthesis